MSGMFDVENLEPGVRRRLDLLRGFLGQDGPGVATKGGDTTAPGRRQRDRSGRVIRKPFALEGHEAEPEAPRRDHRGRRINKPYGQSSTGRTA